MTAREDRKTCTDEATVVHFIGFRDDRYWNAVRIWGPPAFIHYVWDRRALQEIAAGDIVVFATGSDEQEPREFNGPDLVETADPRD